MNPNKTVLGTTEDQALYGTIMAIFVVALYLAAVLILYVCMNGFEEKTRKRQFTQKVFSRKLSSIEGNLNHSRQFYRTLMFTLCITIALLLVIQLSIQQVVIFQGAPNPKALQMALKYIFGLQIVLGYVFMWVRQRLFYYGSSPLRNLLHNKTKLLFLSSFSLTFVLINVVVQMALAWYWNNCTILYEAVTWFSLCLFVQGTLIGLFLYPLWTLNRERKRFIKSTNGNGRVFSSSNSGINGLIRRCVILSSFYFVTDLTLTLVLIITETTKAESIPELVMMVLQNINSIINIACLVSSFRNWLTILFPWRKITTLKRQQTATFQLSSQQSQRRDATESL